MKYLILILATIIIGLHVFSMKLITNHYDDVNEIDNLLIFYFIFFIITQIVGKLLIFYECFNLPIVFIHLVLNCSVFVTFILSIFILNRKYDYLKTILGIILVLSGLYLVETSIL